MRTMLMPDNLDQLLAILAREPECHIMAGGTDLLVRLRSGSNPDRRPLVCLEQVAGLSGVSDEEEAISIGAATTFSRIIADPLLQRYAPLLVMGARTIGGPAIRNMATIGGNIRTASPAGDSLPPLYLLNAELELLSCSGTRRIAISDFITGPGRTVLGEQEIITRVIIPKADNAFVTFFEKVGRRKSLAIAVASLAAMLRFSTDGTVQEARLAWGSVAPAVARVPEAEQALTGQPLSIETVQRAAGLARQAIAPIDDIRASAGYRRTVAGNLLFRLTDTR